MEVTDTNPDQVLYQSDQTAEATGTWLSARKNTDGAWTISAAKVEGTSSYQIKAVDKSGNESLVQTVMLQMDDTAPVIENIVKKTEILGIIGAYLTFSVSKTGSSGVKQENISVTMNGGTSLGIDSVTEDTETTGKVNVQTNKVWTSGITSATITVTDNAGNIATADYPTTVVSASISRHHTELSTSALQTDPEEAIIEEETGVEGDLTMDETAAAEDGTEEEEAIPEDTGIFLPEELKEYETEMPMMLSLYLEEEIILATPSQPSMTEEEAAAEAAAKGLLESRPTDKNQAAPLSLANAMGLVPVWNHQILNGADLSAQKIQRSTEDGKSVWTIDSEKELLLLSMAVNSGSGTFRSGSAVTTERIEDNWAYDDVSSGTIPYLLKYFATTNTDTELTSSELKNFNTAYSVFRLEQKDGDYDLTGSYISKVEEEIEGNGTDHIETDFKEVFKGIGAGYDQGVPYRYSAVKSNGRQFSANFDGDGNVVRLAMDSTYATTQTGFFNYLYTSSGAATALANVPVISNLTVTGSVKGNSFTGAVAGYTDKNSYRFQNITVQDMTVAGEHAGGILGDMGSNSSSLWKDSRSEHVPNFEGITVGSTSIEGTEAAGGVIGYAKATSMFMKDVNVNGTEKGPITISAANAGGAIGRIHFGFVSDYHCQTDYYKIDQSAFTGLEITSTGNAGGIYGSYQEGSRKNSQLHLTELNAMNNQIAGGSSRTGTILGYTNAALTDTGVTYGIYGINVYDEGSTPSAQYGTCGADFHIIRFTDVETLLEKGIEKPPYSDEFIGHEEVLPDVLKDNYVNDASGKLQHMLYDNEQSVELDLDEYFKQWNEAITSDGTVISSDGEKESVINNTLDKVNWVSYESTLRTESGTSTGATGNLVWRERIGFKVKKSDPEKQWSDIKVTYHLYDKKRSSDAGNWPLEASVVIPVRVDLKIGVASQSWLKEGSHPGDNLTSAGSAVENDYKLYTESGSSLTISDDGSYTAYVEMAYSGDRFLIDTTEYDENGDPVLDEAGNEIHDPLCIPKQFELSAPGGNLTIPENTTITMIDLTPENPVTYSYAVESDNVKEVKLTEFKTMRDGVAYEERDVTDEDVLGREIYSFHKGTKKLTDSSAGVERFLFIVNFENTASSSINTSGTPQSRVYISNASGSTDAFGIDDWYDSHQSYVTIGQRRNLEVSATGAPNSFSQSIPLVLSLQLKDAVSGGYTFEKDYVNKAKPYLEMAVSFTSDSSGNQAVDLSQGIKVQYADNKEISTKEKGQILYMKDRDEKYDMSETHTNGAAGVSEKTKNMSLTLDFSNALDFDFKADQQYWAKISLYRSSSAEYPIEERIQTIMIPITVESDAEYGFRLDVSKSDQLNANLNQIANVADAGIDFTSRYSNVSADSNNTSVEYILYRKSSDGTYTPYSDSKLVLNGYYTDGSSLAGTEIGSGCQFNLWNYGETEGEQTYRDTASYLTGSNRTIVGVVTITIQDNQIQTITVVNGETDVAAENKGIGAMIDTIVRENSETSITQTNNAAEAAVLETITELLEGARNKDEEGSNRMKLTGFTDTLPLGNYKLMAHLIVNQVPVAEDFFIFNVNKGVEYDLVQESNALHATPSSAESAAEPSA